MSFGLTRIGAVLLLSMLHGVAFARVDARVDVTNIEGKERKPYSPTILTSALGPSEQQHMLASLASIRSLFRATPALRDLRGHDWQVFATLKTANGRHARAVAVVGYIAHPYFMHRGRAGVSVEGPPFQIYINDPEQMLPNRRYNIDQQAKFATELPITGSMDGFPVYGGEFIYLSKRDEPPFIPVSQERYLSHLIASTRADIAKMNARFLSSSSFMTAGSAGANERYLQKFEQRLQAYEAELAALSPAERDADAYRPRDITEARPSGLAPIGSTDGTRIVTLNPKLYDASKWPGRIQNIVIGTPRYLPQVYGEAQRQIDKAELMKLID